MNLLITCIHDQGMIMILTESKNSSLIQVIQVRSNEEDKFVCPDDAIREECGAAGWTLLSPL